MTATTMTMMLMMMMMMTPTTFMATISQPYSNYITFFIILSQISESLKKKKRNKEINIIFNLVTSLDIRGPHTLVQEMIIQSINQLSQPRYRSMEIVPWNAGGSRAEGYRTGEASSPDVYVSADTARLVFIIVQELNAEECVEEVLERC